MSLIPNIKVSANHDSQTGKLLAILTILSTTLAVLRADPRMLCLLVFYQSPLVLMGVEVLEFHLHSAVSMA